MFSEFLGGERMEGEAWSVIHLSGGRSFMVVSMLRAF